MTNQERAEWIVNDLILPRTKIIEIVAALDRKDREIQRIRDEAALAILRAGQPHPVDLMGCD